MQTLTVVHTKDVEKFLKSLGVLETVKSGECHCSVCNKPISLSNFSAVYPNEGNINFICDSFLCYENVVTQKEKV